MTAISYSFPVEGSKGQARELEQDKPKRCFWKGRTKLTKNALQKIQKYVACEVGLRTKDHRRQDGSLDWESRNIPNPETLEKIYLRKEDIPRTTTRGCRGYRIKG